MGIQSDAKNKIAATDTEKSVVTSANSMLDSLLMRFRKCSPKLCGVGEFVAYTVEGGFDLGGETSH